MSRLGCYRVFWLAVFGGLIAVGAPMVGRPSSALALTDHGRDASANTILEQTLGQPGLAVPITEWLEKLPRGKPVLILAQPGQISASLAADVVAYLAWPRPVVVGLERERSMRLLQNYRERYAAVGMCYLPPLPGAQNVKEFGPALSFTPAAPVESLESIKP